MALVKLSGLITGIVGPVQGTTFQPYRGQTMMRVTGRPLRKSPNAVQQQKQNFGAVKNAWTILPPENKAAWNNAALNFPFKSKTGEMYYGSGYQLFMSCNIILTRNGTAMITDPPIVNLSLLVGSGEEVEIIGMQDKSLVAEWDVDPTATTQLMEIALSRPLPPGRTLRPSSFTSNVTVLVTAGQVSMTQGDLRRMWGFIPTGFFVTFVRFRVIDAVNGFVGTPQFVKLLGTLDDDPEE